MLLMSVQARWLLGIAVIWVSILSGDRAQAQIIPDRTLPNNSIVTPNGSTFNITGGTLSGANLFHSFQEFSVPTGGTAFFNNALDIRNIISRVTGGNFSNIDGLIRTLGTANLFLINPNGIVFGPNASLNVGGSFVASTANAIQFGNQGFFSATNPDASAPLLTINPSALFFNQSTIAAISNSSVAPADLGPTGADVTGLRVPDGQSLLLVGGDVNINGGSLRAYGGRVELAGLAAPGTVGLNLAGNTFSLGIPQDVQRGNVSLSNGAEVNVRAQDGGSIAINAQNVNLAGGSKLRAGIESGLGTQQSKAGDIEINATGETVLSDGSLITNDVQQNAVGNAGNINISTASLSLKNGTQLSASTLGKGDAGNVIIDARGKVSFDGTSSDGQFPSGAASRVSENGVGKGGDIRISADSLSVTNDAQLSASTSGKGDAGNVIIDARGKVSFDGTSTNGQISTSAAFSTVEQNGVGKGGDIRISADSLSVTNGAQLSASTRGKGDAGNVIVDARGKVSFDGTSTNGQISSGAFSRVSQNGVGKGGDIRISADSLSVTNGAALTASTLGKGDAGNVIIDARGKVSFDGTSTNGQISASAALSTVEQNGVGKGGDIRISADSLSVTNGAQLLAVTFGKGDAGNVIIDARGKVSFDGTSTNGQISSGALSTVEQNGVGKGGDIRISTDSLSVTNGAELQALTRGKGDAGNIEIKGNNSVSVKGISLSGGFSSGLFTSTLPNSTGIGSNITVNTPLLRVSDGAVLDAQTANNRNGGNIILNVKQAEILNGGQLVSISSGAGNAGKITVNATDKVIVSGSDPTFNQRLEKFGRPTVDPIDASSGIFVLSQSTGSAGNIIVTSPQIRLNNLAKLSADTIAGEGNIQLTTPALILRRGSSITTNANGSQITGGNIIIDSQNGFIVAVPGEISYISANSANFRGGNITINNSANIFGIEQTTAPSSSRSYITATGATPDLSGNIRINRANVNQPLGLAKLPTVVANTPTIKNTSCEAFAEGKDSSFTVTGRGGLPPNPYDLLSSEAVWSDNRVPNIVSQHPHQETPKAKPSSKATVMEINPATGWVFHSNGLVTLISQNKSSNGLQSNPTTCQTMSEHMR